MANSDQDKTPAQRSPQAQRLAQWVAKNPRGVRKLVLIFGAIMVVGGGGTCLWGAYDLKYARASENWPEAHGVILSSKVERRGPSSGDAGYTYEPNVRYRYTVNGRQYTNDRVFYGATGSSDSGWAHTIVARHPVGAGAMVRYDPEKPSRSVLEAGVTATTHLQFIVGGPIALFGLFLAVAAGVALLRRRGAARPEATSGATDQET